MFIIGPILLVSLHLFMKFMNASTIIFTKFYIFSHQNPSMKLFDLPPSLALELNGDAVSEGEVAEGGGAEGQTW